MKQTLPAGTRNWAWGLDVIRKHIRRSPHLQRLGEMVGPVKVYGLEELEAIRKELEQREAAKCAAV